MTFGEKILKLRKEHGMTQEALAEQLNTSRQAVSKWENGQGFPETEKILMMGNIFGVSIDYLLKDIEEPVSEEKEKGFYASREFVCGYIISSKKKAKLLAGGLFFTISPTIFPNLLINYTAIANVLMLVLMAAGISMLGTFAFQIFFTTDRYRVIGKEPLIFDNNFLKEFKENYQVLMKKYFGMIVLSVALLFGGIILAHLAKSNLADSIFLLLIATAVYLATFAIYMLVTHSTIINQSKRIC